MKKTLILGSIFLMTAMSAFAQKAVLKAADKAAKDGKEVSEIVEIITPAMSDPETANNPEIYTIPGNAAFNLYDKMLGLKTLNKLPEGGDIKMSNDLLLGYEYLNKALPLDSLPNEKGKISPKHSKKIFDTIGGHYRDYLDAGYTFFQSEKYNEAANTWDIVISLSSDPRYSKSIPKEVIVPDSTIAELLYNNALAAYFAKDSERSLKYFHAAKDKGYNKKLLYDYAMSVAAGIQDENEILYFAQAALPIYGSQDPNYMGQIISAMLNKKEYDKAMAMVDDALASDPNNSQYYVIKGVLLEQQGSPWSEVKVWFKKAVDCGAENSQAQYNYGRALCEEAYKINDAAPIDNESEYRKIYEGEILPRFNEAVEYLEKAYQLDENNKNALRYLKNVYYNLHNEAKEKEIDLLLM